MVNYIRTTETSTGLKVCARLFPKGYQKGETISDLKCDNFSLPLTRLYPAGTTPLLHTKCETILARLLSWETPCLLQGQFPGSPEVGFWSITLLARSFCGTCPTSQFLDSQTSGCFADHFVLAGSV